MTQCTKCRGFYLDKCDKGEYEAEKIYTNRKEKINISFLLTQDCNAKCPYCYQDSSFRKTDTNFTIEQIDKTMEFILSTFEEDKIAFTLFGGEPLLNFEAVKYLIENYPMLKFTLTTNGYLINQNPEIAEWLIKHKYNIHLSVSVSALKYLYPNKSFKEASENCLNVVNEVGGDVHYVVADPTIDGIFDDIKLLFDSPVQLIRVSTARQWDLVKDTILEMTELFKKVIDYAYFTGEPKLGRMVWDNIFKSNQYNKEKNLPLIPVPPTHCGAGYMYLAIDYKGNMFPCDNFAFMEEFKLGDIYNGFDKNSIYFTKVREWMEQLYSKCDDCSSCESILDCPRALCLAENYIVNRNPFIPTENHCLANKVEYDAYEYLIKRAIETGLDEKIRKYIL